VSKTVRTRSAGWFGVALSLVAIALVVAGRHRLRHVDVTFFAAPKAAAHLPPPPATRAGEGPLVYARNLTYEGAFRLPDEEVNGTSFAYGGAAVAFNPANHSLFIVGHEWQQKVAEIAIPEIRSTTTVRHLATATLLQPFFDPTQGRRGAVGDGTVKIGGLLPYGGRLYTTVYVYYDAIAMQRLSHFVSPLTASGAGGPAGPFQVGTSGAGFVSGYLGVIPPPWRDRLGGAVLTGQCCIPIISRTSYGPSAFAIDPSRLGAETPLHATPLVEYPHDHPLAPGDTASPLFTLATQITGVVFHEGTRSVLFFGRHGAGRYCYGPGTSSKEQADQPADGGVDRWCFDPTSESKGTHAFPYSYYVWAYDANELAAVKAGSKQPWDVKPYATWPIALPFSTDGAAVLNGAAYDPESGRIFLSQAFGDGERPVIHVLTVHIF
jgi:hypothetical protein